MVPLHTFNSTMIPSSTTLVDHTKSPEDLGTEFAAVFFKQVISHMLNTVGKTDEDQEDLWQYFQAEIFAQQLANTEVARPIREAVSRDIIRLQEIHGEPHVKRRG